MGCFKIAAIALRMLSADTDHVSAEPSIFVQSGCALEVGAVWRDGHAVADIGIRIAPKGFPLWLRLGAEGDYVRRVTVMRSPAPRDGVQGHPRGEIKETVARVLDIRPRASIGADIRLAGRTFLSPEIEATRGGRFLLALRHRF